MATPNQSMRLASPEAVTYDPFAVDDRWLTTAYSTLSAVQISLTSRDTETMRVLTAQDAAKCRSKPSYDPATTTLYSEVFYQALRLQLSTGEPTKNFDQSLRERIFAIDGPMAEATNVTKCIIGYAQQGAENYREYVEASDELVRQTDAPGQSPAFHYSIVKLLAGTIPRPLDGGFEWPARNVLSCMLFLGKSALPTQLGSKIAEGDFDGFIANDLVRFVGRTTSNIQNGDNAIADLWRFTRSFSDQNDLTVLARRLAEHHMVWPKEASLALSASRKRLHMGYQRAIEWAQSSGGGGEFLQVANDRTDPEEGFVRALEKYFAQAGQPAIMAAGVAYSTTGLNKRRLRAHSLAAQKRRNSRRSDTDISMEQVFEGVTPEKAVPNWQLVQLKSDGSLTSSGDTDSVIETAFADYRDDYEPSANDPILLFVRSMLNNLRHLDFSNGSVPGVKKLTDATLKAKNNTDTSFSIMEYKPMDVPGATSAAKRAKKLRILFAMTGPNTLGVLKTLERDDLYEYLRSIGVSAGRKG